HRLGKVLSIACRRIGQGTRVDYLRRICDTTFGGVVRVIDDLTKLEKEFTDWVTAIYETVINDLRLVIETEPGVEVDQVLQVTPSVIPLTDYLGVEPGRQHVIHLGSVNSQKRRFYVKLSIGKELIEGQSTRLALVHVAYQAEGIHREDPSWGRVIYPVAVLVR